MRRPVDYKVGDLVDHIDREQDPPIDLSGPLHWHIVIAESQHEKSAADRMRDELGLRPYLPVLHKQIPAGRRRKRDIAIPMFGSRIFVPMPRSALAWHRVRYLRGVHDFMTTDGRRPALLSDAVITEIRRTEARVDAKYRRRMLADAESPYRKGRQVWAEVLPAPYNKLLATIEDLDERGRVNVLLEIELMGRKVWPLEPHRLQFAAED